MSDADFKAWTEQCARDMRANLEHWGNDPDGGDDLARQRESRFHPPDEAPAERVDFDPDQPRDDHGRFAGAGVGLEGHGRGSSSGVGRPGGETAKSPKASPGEQLVAKMRTPREWVGRENPDHSWSGRVVGTSDETWKDHFTRTPDGKLDRPTPERQRSVVQPIYENAFERHQTAAQLGQDKPVAILTMGGMASGKGVIISRLEKEGLNPKHYVLVDPDHIKGSIPEFQQSVPQPARMRRDGSFVPASGGLHGDGRGPTFRGAATQVHEESSYIAKTIRDRAVAEGHNVIIDGSGAKHEKYIAMIQDLKARGYEVHVHHPVLDVEEGLRRAKGRSEEGGRLVPESVLRGSYEGIARGQAHIAAAAPNMTVYDARERVPGDKSTSHRVMYEKREGRDDVIHDPKFVHDYLKTHDRTDDWNEELHPRTPAGGAGGGQFTSGGGGGGGPAHGSGGSAPFARSGEGYGGGGGGTSHIVGLHRLTSAKVDTAKVLERSGLPKDKLYQPGEPPAHPPERAVERAALAKVLVLKETPPPPPHDPAKDGHWDDKTKTATLGSDAKDVLKQLTPDQHEALRKYSNRYDFAMKQVEAGADRTKLAAGTESFWKSNLAGKGIDVDKMQPDEKAKTYQEHFGHPNGADFVAAAAKAVDDIHDTFAKVAPTPGVVYRGLNNIPPSHVEKILNSKTMTLDTMSSFSFSHDVGHDYATGAQASKAAGTDVSKASKYGDDKVLPNGVQVVMRMTHKSGINMMGASDFKKEQEVLLPKGAKFKLTHVTREGNFDAKKLDDKDPPIVVVHMEEI